MLRKLLMLSSYGTIGRLVIGISGLVSLGASTALGQSRYAATEINSRLFEELNVYQRGSAGDDTRQLRAAAEGRQQLLQSLIYSDPAAVLTAALPEDVRDKLPRAARDLVEQHVKIQGEMEVAIEDGPNYSRVYYGLQAGGRRLGLHFAGAPPSGIQTGTPVVVEGVQVGSELALTASAMMAMSTISTSILPNTFGAQSTLVILVNFQDLTTQPFTPSSAQSMVFTTVSNFWLENSFQQTWMIGAVAGWYTIPVSSTTCNTSAIQTYAQQAAQSAGYVLSNYAHFLYIFPDTSACGWSGYSVIGGVPSNSWDNGSLTQQLISHELGHGLGLYHSHSLNCGSVVYASSGCTQYEYGDYYDSMASSNVNGYGFDYNAFQKEQLGWLNYSAEPPITTVTSSASYSLSPLETQDTQPKALKILESATSGSYYYVELRQAIGFDNLLSYGLTGYSEVLNGVVVHMATPGSGNSVNLLNMNPSSSWGSAMALDVGQSYTDSAAGITISTTTVSSTGATVQVTLAGSGSTCTRANPSLSLSGPSGSVAPGAMATFTVTVKDNDSSGCSSSQFAMGDSIPSGWSAVYSASSVTLAPGGSMSVTLTVTVPAGTANGTYSIGANTYNTSATSFTASATSSLTVYSAPSSTVSITTNQTTYTPGQKITSNVTVLSGTSPMAGVTVTVQITQSNGSIVSLSGTTGSNGVAAVGYQTKKTAPAGTWTAKGSYNAASASTSFVMQ